jgi:hypothetical protein
MAGRSGGVRQLLAGVLLPIDQGSRVLPGAAPDRGQDDLPQQIGCGPLLEFGDRVDNRALSSSEMERGKNGATAPLHEDRLGSSVKLSSILHV